MLKKTLLKRTFSCTLFLRRNGVLLRFSHDHEELTVSAAQGNLDVWHIAEVLKRRSKGETVAVFAHLTTLVQGFIAHKHFLDDLKQVAGLGTIETHLTADRITLIMLNKIANPAPNNCPSFIQPHLLR